MRTTIVIPSWNGREILEKSLPVVMKLAKGEDILVYDDGSKDDTEEYIRKYPRIRYMSSEVNKGFTKAINAAVAAVSTEFVCLLNNDVYPKEGFLEKAIKILDDDSRVAGVSFNEEHSSWPRAAWTGGKLNFSQGNKDGVDHYCLWPSGGSCLLRTEVFRRLGGFNEVFSPGYFEDIEFGFRVWRSGAMVVWSKDAQVVHRHETSFRRLDPQFVSDLKQTNELVFNWLVFGGSRMFVEHLIFLASYTLTHPGYLRIILKAVAKYLRLKRAKSPNRISLEQVLVMANQAYVKA